MDPKIAHFLKVAVATIIFHLIDRQSEYIQRVGFMQETMLMKSHKLSFNILNFYQMEAETRREEENCDDHKGNEQNSRAQHST
jgi:hypothetical protein